MGYAGFELDALAESRRAIPAGAYQGHAGGDACQGDRPIGAFHIENLALDFGIVGKNAYPTVCGPISCELQGWRADGMGHACREAALRYDEDQNRPTDLLFPHAAPEQKVHWRTQPSDVQLQELSQ